MIARVLLPALIAMLGLSGPATAEAPETSLRPQPRAMVSSVPTPAETAALAQSIAQYRLRPQVRPPSQQSLMAAARPETLPFVSVETSSRPWLRPDGIVKKAMAKRRARRKGAVCGDVDIQGEVVGYVPGRIKACGIKDAVRVRSVAGVALSQQALVNCTTAKSLKKWVESSVKPAFAKRDPVVQLNVAAHYACRTRNNQPGGKISEHGKGNAIDISGFKLKSGKVMTVLSSWHGKTPLQRLHKAACGPFGTVLGPRSDRYHQDHFHLDVARHRGGPYCR
ncbi:extensin-like domain-containing protein [Arenibacterium sp. CAU 1754]